jgi:flagellar hook assembly protein FlgD
MSTTLTFTAKITDENGKEIIVPINIESKIPDIEAFLDGKNFANNFDQIEKAVIKARKNLSEKVIEEYLGESTKKKQLRE